MKDTAFSGPGTQGKRYTTTTPNLPRTFQQFRGSVRSGVRNSRFQQPPGSRPDKEAGGLGGPCPLAQLPWSPKEGLLPVWARGASDQAGSSLLPADSKVKAVVVLDCQG